MTNQEVVQALQEYIQMDRRLNQLLQQKTKIEKEIKYYRVSREEPQPQRPSKFRILSTSCGISCFIGFGFMFIFSDFIPNIELWAILGIIVLTCIITPIYYKREDAEACARYVTAGMQYHEWEEGKRKQLPLLQNQLNQVMDEGGSLYKKFQNAKLRTFLHSDYLPHSETILGYFNRGRVRDLTEAVNLLEHELLEHRRDRETAAYRREMQRQACAQTAAAEEATEQSRQAAAAAKEAAFWGAAATFAAATNSKRDNSGNYRVV